ncbi:hypothetical protein TNCV_3668171 [Trichonephila clavipes]|nr:hypothetical protein TNCV_3668171 [Trichonephila clavipes]
MADDRRAASPCWAPCWEEAYWGEQHNTLMEPSRKSPSVELHSLEFCDSFHFFIVKTPEAFANISPFLIEKAFTSSIGRSRRFVRCAPGTCSSKCHRRNRRPPYKSAKSLFI